MADSEKSSSVARSEATVRELLTLAQLPSAASMVLDAAAFEVQGLHVMQSLQAQVLQAKSNAEALDKTIRAAEILLTALKLTKDQNEKRALELQCNAFMDQAERIKHNELGGKSSHVRSEPHSAGPTHDDIGRWASAVTGYKDPPSTSMTAQPAAVDPFESLIAFSDGDQSHNGTEPTSSCVSGRHENATLPAPLIASNHTSLDRVVSGTVKISEARHELGPAPKSGTSTAQGPVRPDGFLIDFTDPEPKRSPPTLPKVVRDLTKKEEILLMRASKVGDSVFPPWRGAPDSSEFALKEGDEIFT